MKTLISFAVLTALLSCGPAPELKRRILVKGLPDKLEGGKANLDTMSRDEVLKIKYENKAILKCDLQINKNLTHNISVNLAEGPDREVRKYQYELEGKTLDIEIDPSLKIFQNYKHPLNDPRYEMKNSAVAEVIVSWTVSSPESAPVMNNESLILPENVPQTLLMQVVRDSGIKQFACSLKTSPVKEYSDQFKELPEDEKSEEILPEAETLPGEETIAQPESETTPETAVEVPLTETPIVTEQQ